MEDKEKKAPDVDALKNELSELAAKKAMAGLPELIDKKLTEFKEELAKQPVSMDEDSKGLIERLDQRLEELEARAVQQEVKAVETKTVGERFVEDSDVQRFLNRGYHKGSVAAKIENGFFPEWKTTITSATVGSSTPGILIPSRVPGIVPAARRRLTIRDILPVFRTTNNTVEFVKEDTFTSAASPQTEGSAKAESALTFTIDYEVVRTLAHWIPATAQVLDDMDGLARFINETMLYGLKLDEEDELLNGSGSGVHLSGLTTEATAYADTYNAASDTDLDTVRHGILEAEDHDETVDFIVLNPVDYHDIELIKDAASNVGNYVVGDPLGGVMPIRTLWGRTVIVTNSMAAGYFMVGNSSKAAIWDRMDATVDISTEHDDYFTKNLVAIRVEERLTLTTYRGGAFIYGAL
jgi:HK97 family phage major capsid protein